MPRIMLRIIAIIIIINNVIYVVLDIKYKNNNFLFMINCSNKFFVRLLRNIVADS